MFKKLGFLFFIASAILVGCSPTADLPGTPVPPTQVPTVTSLIARDGTPMPEGGSILSPSNVEEIEEFARWGAGWLEDTALSADETVLYIQHSLSVTAYDSTTKEELWKFAPEEGVGSMVIHEGNAQVAVGGTSGSLWVLDSTSGEIIYEWRADTEKTVVVAFSEEGDWLASGSEYGTAKVRHLPDGVLAFEMDELDFYDSGIAVAQNKLIATNRVFDLETGELVFSEGRILQVFADAGLVATDLGSFVALQRLEDGEQVASYDVRIPEEELEDAGAVIARAALSDDQTKLAIGFFGERRVLVFDVESGERLQNLFISAEDRPMPETLCFGFVGVKSMDFSDDGNELTVINSFAVFDSWDLKTGEIDIWDLNTSELLSTTSSDFDESMNPPDSGYNDDPIQFSQDGAWMASGTNLWNIETGALQIFSGETVIGFSGDQQFVYTSDISEGKVKQYSLDDFQLQQEVLISSEPSYGCSVYGQTVSPDGLYFEIIGLGEDVLVWDIDNAVELPNEWISSSYPDEVLLAAEKNWLVVEAYGGQVSIFDLATQEQLSTFEIDEQVEEAAISANGETLAVAGWDEEVYVWDLNEADPSRLDLDSGGHWLPFMEEVAVSADGNLVAADCTDTLLIWDAHSGEILFRFLFGDEEDIFDTIYDLAFSPDGRYLAILMSDGSIRLWGVHS